MRTLLIDDFREYPADRTERTFESGLKAIQDEIWDILLLDHDLGACEDCIKKGLHIGDMKTPETTFMNNCPHAKTGYDILCFLERNPKHKPGNIVLVTANPVGRERMNIILGKLYPKESQ